MGRSAASWQRRRPRLIGTVTNAVRRACDRQHKARTQGTEGRVTAPNGAIKIEWGGDLESFKFKWTDWDGSARGRYCPPQSGAKGKQEHARHHARTSVEAIITSRIARALMT